MSPTFVSFAGCAGQECQGEVVQGQGAQVEQGAGLPGAAPPSRSGSRAPKTQRSTPASTHHRPPPAFGKGAGCRRLARGAAEWEALTPARLAPPVLAQISWETGGEDWVNGLADEEYRLAKGPPDTGERQHGGRSRGGLSSAARWSCCRARVRARRLLTPELRAAPPGNAQGAAPPRATKSASGRRSSSR